MAMAGGAGEFGAAKDFRPALRVAALAHFLHQRRHELRRRPELAGGGDGGAVIWTAAGADGLLWGIGRALERGEALAPFGSPSSAGLAASGFRLRFERGHSAARREFDELVARGLFAREVDRDDSSVASGMFAAATIAASAHARVESMRQARAMTSRASGARLRPAASRSYQRARTSVRVSARIADRDFSDQDIRAIPHRGRLMRLEDAEQLRARARASSNRGFIGVIAGAIAATTLRAFFTTSSVSLPASSRLRLLAHPSLGALQILQQRLHRRAGDGRGLHQRAAFVR